MSASHHNSQPKLLVLGGPSSGKTTYRTQLYHRIEHGDGEIRLLDSVSDMRSLANDVERMVKGLQPMHTQLETYHSTTFSVVDRAKRAITLEFPDYGGEQIRRIGETNMVPTPWTIRAKESSGWLYLLRIDDLRMTKSFMTAPVESGPKQEIKSDDSFLHRPAELNAIETLQRLLFVRGASLRYPLSNLRLGMLLSCWDELSLQERNLSPTEVLANRAPLLSRFIQANWISRELKVWGLSSTERKLPEDKPDLEFARKGPDKFGYVVQEDGKSNPDLTIPINWLIPRS